MGDGPSREQIARAQGLAVEVQGRQMGFFGEDGQPLAPEAPSRGPGRPQGAGNKAKGRVKDWLAAKGYRDPAEQLAMLAGLDQRDIHPILHAAKLAGVIGVPVDVILREMRQAADALMPYWHAKLTPDVQVNLPPVPIMMQVNGGLSIDAGALAGHPFAPADVRAGWIEGSVENQDLGQADASHSDNAIRTEGTSD